MRSRFGWALLVGVLVVLSLARGAGVSLATASQSDHLYSESLVSVADSLPHPAFASLGTVSVSAPGTALSCSFPGGGALNCDRGRPTTPAAWPTPRAPVGSRDPPGPASAPGVDPAWYNQTSSMNAEGQHGASYRQYEAASAYDPVSAQVVVFGGCSASCPSNETWAWDGTNWTNETPLLAASPPPVDGESMAWDPALNGTIMVGGVLAGGSVSNMTWELSSTPQGAYVWFNLTPSVGTYDSSVGTAYASLAYDDGLHELLLVDGCATGDCVSAWSSEWALNALGWSAIGPGPAGSIANSYLAGASMAYDRAAQEMVFFGGFSVSTGVDVGFTYALAASGIWTNLTSSSESCSPVCSYPEDRSGASMTWDGQLQEVVLVGGYSFSVGRIVNDTWYFSAGSWYPSSSGGSIPGPNAVTYGTMPVNSTGIAPVLLGGVCTGTCLNDSWVLEVPPQPQFTAVSPSPSDAGMPVTIVGSNELGSGSGPIYTEQTTDSAGDAASGRYFGNFSNAFSFTTSFVYGPGTWELSLVESDFFGVHGVAVYDLEVNGKLALSPSFSPSPAELSGPAAAVAFTGAVVNGSLPFSYLWYFGDGFRSTESDPIHSYTRAGSFACWLNVSDSAGAYSNSSFVVTVYPQLTGTPTANVTTTEAGS